MNERIGLPIGRPPVIAAPMAGGASTDALVNAAALAGGYGFLAGGYQQPDALAADIAAARVLGVPCGRPGAGW